MTKFGLACLVMVGVLSGCAMLNKRPPAPSQFLTPLSNTLLAIQIPARGANATLVLVATNQGVETWQTGDNVSVSLRNGVIVATRGLGFDVMGSDVQPTLDALAGRLSGSYSVKRRYLTADNHSEMVSAACTMAKSGADRRYIEDCTGTGGTFRNEYWLDAAGRIARSNQWVGPQVQYLGTSYAKAG